MTKIEMRDIESISPYPGNAKIHEPKQVEKIAQSIREFGWTQPIIVDKDGVIIAGHGRRLAALILEYKTVPVIVRHDLSGEQVRALRLADNRVGISGMDSDKLQEELAFLAGIDFEMDGIFDKKELEFMQADLSIIDDSKFIDDIDEAVREQASETIEKVSAADDKEIPIAKALGFKTIKTKDEKYVAAFIATIEQETGREGADAFIQYVKDKT